jgi:hypothetical protein
VHRLVFEVISCREKVHEDLPRWKRPNEQEPNLSTALAFNEMALAAADIAPIGAATARASEVHDLHLSLPPLGRLRL